MPELRPWDCDRLTALELDAMFAGALWRMERAWDVAMVSASLLVAAQGGKLDPAAILGREPGTSVVPGYEEDGADGRHRR